MLSWLNEGAKASAAQLDGATFTFEMLDGSVEPATSFGDSPILQPTNASRRRVTSILTSGEDERVWMRLARWLPDGLADEEPDIIELCIFDGEKSYFIQLDEDNLAGDEEDAHSGVLYPGYRAMLFEAANRKGDPFRSTWSAEHGCVPTLPDDYDGDERLLNRVRPGRRLCGADTVVLETLTRRGEGQPWISQRRWIAPDLGFLVLRWAAFEEPEATETAGKSPGDQEPPLGRRVGYTEVRQVHRAGDLWLPEFWRTVVLTEDKSRAYVTECRLRKFEPGPMPDGFFDDVVPLPTFMVDKITGSQYRLTESGAERIRQIHPSQE